LDQEVEVVAEAAAFKVDMDTIKATEAMVAMIRVMAAMDMVAMEVTTTMAVMDMEATAVAIGTTEDMADIQIKVMDMVVSQITVKRKREAQLMEAIILTIARQDYYY
jgi:DNA-binding NarL/FixJ family response regulator